MSLINSIISQFTAKRLKQIEHFKQHPIDVQRETLVDLLRKAAGTEYGQRYDFASLWTREQYRERVPVIHYEEVAPYAERMMNGEQGLLWPTPVKWFAKSSGTTAARSKFIPVSPEALEDCHFRGGRDVIALFNRAYPDASVFTGKTLALGGSSEVVRQGSDCRVGDLSAILISNTPTWVNWMKVPDQSVMLMGDWERKIERILDTTLREDVRALAGVPSWFLTLIQRVLERTGKANLHEVWPRLELFIHGGISFTPYREQYNRLLPDARMKYMETYNASEGFFGVQDDPDDSAMLLMLDYGVYYEFLPVGEWDKPHPRALLLDEVEVGKNYALVITTNGGLWRYCIGDTVQFTSTRPYKFRITGRTKLYINAFGEELIVDNAIEAMRCACERTGVSVRHFTAAPVFMQEGQQGAHEWIVEFETPPADPESFADVLDEELRRVNSDYDAKRLLSLRRLTLHVARPGLFTDWLKSKGKLGGQNKVPQLSNERTHVEELLRLQQEV